MSDDQINDLKQSITTVISQQTTGVRDELREDINELRIDVQSLDIKLTKQMTNLSLSVGEALNASSEILGKQIDDHEKHLTRLEHQPA